MIAIPYAFAAADSAPAVEIARGMRDKMESVAGRDYQVVADSVMNSALLQYGYSKDAILSPMLALNLAKNIQARVLVASSLTKLDGNRYRVQARLTGTSDDAGYTVVVAQAPGSNLKAFGQQIVTTLEPALKSLDEAKACVDQRTTKPDKASEEGLKALKDTPNNGLAAYCMAQISIDKKAPRAETIKYLEQSVAGDSLSLPVWTALASQYQQANDTAKALSAFSQMLRVAPTNQKLREELFRQFLTYGAPDRARKVADEGLALDPYNRDLYDLKSNACLFQSDFKCAVESLEQAYTIDSTSADTLFFAKISVAAQQKPDTVNLLKWSRIGTKKYPENVTLLGYLNQAYALTGQLDSTLVTTQKLQRLDPENSVNPSLAAVQALAAAKRLKEAQVFSDFIEKKGDATQKEQLALMYVNAALPYIQAEPRDPASAIELSGKAVTLASPTGKLYATANYILGLAKFISVTQLDPEVEKQKSCEMAKQEQSLLDDAEKALNLGKTAKPDVVATYLDYVGKFRPRAASMIKTFCK
jgi:tetratricopeptide (TPR) repeat protein